MADAAAAEPLLDAERVIEVAIEEAELETATTAAEVEGDAELEELMLMLDDDEMMALVELEEDEAVDPVVEFPSATSEPVPHGIEAPPGCVELEGSVVVPSAAAMVKRVVHSGVVDALDENCKK